MNEWRGIVPQSKGLYFYRPGPGVESAVVERIATGFLFHGVERVVEPKNMVGEFWSEGIKRPENCGSSVEVSQNCSN